MASAAAAFVSPLRGVLPLRPSAAAAAAAAAAACGRRSSWLAPRPAATAAATAATPAAAPPPPPDCLAQEEGEPGSENYRIYFRRHDGSLCSPWHHIYPFPRRRGIDPSEALEQKETPISSSPYQDRPYTPGSVAAAADHFAAAAVAAAAPPVAAAFDAVSGSAAATSTAATATAAAAAAIPAAAAGEEGLFIRYVAEIARGSLAKNEIVKAKPWNPIEQDRNPDGSLRYLRWPMDWSYGSIPQTWADPGLATVGPDVSGLGGDDDPLDVIEVTEQQHNPGTIVTAKVIGGLFLIDSGEVDLKVLVVSVGSPLFPLLHTPIDLDRLRPGFLATSSNNTPAATTRQQQQQQQQQKQQQQQQEHRQQQQQQQKQEQQQEQQQHEYSATHLA
ncbi:hypothetical protein ACSSS7_002697 [Eimeria intestinalis]